MQSTTVLATVNMYVSNIYNDVSKLDNIPAQDPAVCLMVQDVVEIEDDEIAECIRQTIAYRFSQQPIVQDDVTLQLAGIRERLDRHPKLDVVHTVQYWKRDAEMVDTLPTLVSGEWEGRFFKSHCVLFNNRKPPGSSRYLHIEMQFNRYK
jgi:predicted transcriptional regulator